MLQFPSLSGLSKKNYKHRETRLVLLIEDILIDKIDRGGFSEISRGVSEPARKIQVRLFWMLFRLARESLDIQDPLAFKAAFNNGPENWERNEETLIWTSFLARTNECAYSVIADSV